ncbi:ENTH-domain-containing protein [Suillus decipiens]|nr:ENTH-domain-containing protein [Suillus decipiens]
MDRFDSLASTLSNLTVYDLKNMYNQAKNVVLNISEMESKVREATNDEPWGASSTLMQEIAQGTFNFQNFNEIMPCIYARFMEKEARQWRQIYKALQLLEYLIKHGSERVVDDSRSHISTLKMLRNFHYIDDKGKDEGQNVRNRARELVDLLSDVEAIRTERRKAKANRHKYTGTGNDAMSFSSGGSRFGGFGSDSFSSGSGGYYGDRMSGRDDYGGSSGFRDSNGRKDFEEYTAGDDETVVRRSGSISRSHAGSRQGTQSVSSVRPTQPAPPKPKEPEVDLLGGFGDEPVASAGVNPVSNTNKALPTVGNVNIDDDDFADFQAAPSSPAPSSPVPASAPLPTKPTLMEMLRSTSPPASRAPMMSPSLGSQVPKPAAFANTSVRPLSPTNRQIFPSTAGGSSGNLWSTSTPLSPTTSVRTSMSAAPIISAVPPPKASSATSPKSSSNFEDLWSLSLGTTTPTVRSGNTGKSIKDLEKEKAQAGIWASSQKPGATQMGMGSGFGNFGGMGTSGGTSTSAGDDDLLL